MIRKALIAFAWFPLTLCLLAVNLSLLISFHQVDAASVPVVRRTAPSFMITASSTGTEQVLGAMIEGSDARALVLEQFLQKHGSPLAEYAEYFVDRADYYGIDFRLVPAIAMCESNAGKRMPTKASHNAWGISVETGETTGANFTSWYSAIHWVTRYMKEKYFARGITDLVDIGAIYAPPSVANGNSWANCVSQFMEEIQ